MKRKTKNILIITLIIIMLLSIYLTMNYAKNHITINNTPSNMPEMNMPQDKPSDNQNNSSNNEETNQNDKENNNMTPPAKPSDDEFENNKENNIGAPPEKPDGTNENMTPPEKPDGSNDTMTPPDMSNSNSNLTWPYYLIFTIESLITSSLIIYLIMSNLNKKSFKETFENKDKVLITILSVVILTSGLTYLSTILCNNYFLTNNNNNNFNPGNNSNITYSSNNKITEDTTITSGTYTSSTKDENTLLVDSSTVSLSDITVNKTGDSDGGDNTSFYGTNSAILAINGATLNIDNITVNTAATGANGVFSYGGSATTNNSSSDGTTINISNSTITTTKDNSGGIMTTGGGTMNATNLNITTSGTSSAAIRTDRGGGTVVVDGGTYKTTGKGSPTIYSTANIKVSNAKLISTSSEGIVIEGKNSVEINNCNLTDTNNELNGKSTTYKNIFMYQSMSGDAAEGTSTFTANSSVITTNKGDTFYITNTTATINLTNNTITNNDTEGSFLRAQSDSWGNTGSNGATVYMNTDNQKMTGNIIIDNISTLSMNMKNNSSYEGTINNSNTAKSITITLDKTSTIKLTGDSYITSLVNSDSTNSNIDFNGYKLYVNNVAIN